MASSSSRRGSAGGGAAGGAGGGDAGKGPPERVQVVCRVRPAEDSWDSAVSLAPGDGGDVVSVAGSQRTWAVTKAFGAESSQEDVYELVGRPSVDYVMQGYGACILAYGQTGSGKTFTMTGTESSPGLIPRIIGELFSRLVSGYDDFTVVCQYVEIYMEKARDLFNPPLARNPWDAPGPKVNLRYDGKRAQLENVKRLSFGNDPALRGKLKDDELARALRERLLREVEAAGRHRAVRGHALNAESSRSHAALVLEATARRPGKEIASTLMLIDLAGSENISKAQVEGVGREEAKSINKSLSVLSRCIEALAERRKVPFRESMLTKLLTPALDGRSCCTLIAALRGDHASETRETLKFTETALKVKVRPRQASSEALGAVQDKARDLRSEIAALKQEIEWLRQSGAGSAALRGMVLEKESAVRAKVEALAALQAEIRETEDLLSAVQQELDVSKQELQQERAGRLRAEAATGLLEARLREAEQQLLQGRPAEQRGYGWRRVLLEGLAKAKARGSAEEALEWLARLARHLCERSEAGGAQQHLLAELGALAVDLEGFLQAWPAVRLRLADVGRASEALAVRARRLGPLRGHGDSAGSTEPSEPRLGRGLEDCWRFGSLAAVALEDFVGFEASQPRSAAARREDGGPEGPPPGSRGPGPGTPTPGALGAPLRRALLSLLGARARGRQGLAGQLGGAAGGEVEEDVAGAAKVLSEELEAVAALFFEQLRKQLREDSHRAAVDAVRRSCGDVPQARPGEVSLGGPDQQDEGGRGAESGEVAQVFERLSSLHALYADFCSWAERARCRFLQDQDASGAEAADGDTEALRSFREELHGARAEQQRLARALREAAEREAALERLAEEAEARAAALQKELESSTAGRAELWAETDGMQREADRAALARQRALLAKTLEMLEEVRDSEAASDGPRALYELVDCLDGLLRAQLQATSGAELAEPLAVGAAEDEVGPTSSTTPLAAAARRLREARAWAGRPEGAQEGDGSGGPELVGLLEEDGQDFCERLRDLLLSLAQQEREGGASGSGPAVEEEDAEGAVPSYLQSCLRSERARARDLQLRVLQLEAELRDAAGGGLEASARAPSCREPEDILRAAAHAARAQAAARSDPLLVTLDESGPEYCQVRASVEGTASLQHGLGLVVSRVRKVTNLGLEAAFFEGMAEQAAREGQRFPLVVSGAFHGTDAGLCELIAEGGFCLPKDLGAELGRYGNAVYLTNCAASANAFCRCPGHLRSLLVCDVAPGRVLTSGASESDLPSSADLASIQELGYDSAFAAARRGDCRDEYAVYDPRLALPRYVVDFRLAGLGPERQLREPAPLPALRADVARLRERASGAEGGREDAEALKAVYRRMALAYRDASGGKSEGFLLAVQRHEEPELWDRCARRLSQALADGPGLASGLEGVMTRLECVVNPALAAVFYERAAGLLHPEEAFQWLFHRARLPDCSALAERGLEATPPDGGAARSFGPGIYLSTGVADCPGRASLGSHRLLLCEVALGTPMLAQASRPRLDLDTVQRAGFDSVHAPRGGGTECDLWVVYDAAQALPAYLLSYDVQPRTVAASLLREMMSLEEQRRQLDEQLAVVLQELEDAKRDAEETRNRLDERLVQQMVEEEQHLQRVKRETMAQREQLDMERARQLQDMERAMAAGAGGAAPSHAGQLAELQRQQREAREQQDRLEQVQEQERLHRQRQERLEEEERQQAQRRQQQEEQQRRRQRPHLPDVAQSPAACAHGCGRAADAGWSTCCGRCRPGQDAQHDAACESRHREALGLAPGEPVAAEASESPGRASGRRHMLPGFSLPSLRRNK